MEVRNYHQAMLRKAQEELARPTTHERFERRLISSVCFAGTEEKLREAKLILEEAMYRVANLMSENSGCDQLYQLNLQLFPFAE
jgi:hypothetical protein